MEKKKEKEKALLVILLILLITILNCLISVWFEGAKYSF